jgi:hypothetical protein
MYRFVLVAFDTFSVGTVICCTQGMAAAQSLVQHGYCRAATVEEKSGPGVVTYDGDGVHYSDGRVMPDVEIER